MIHEISLMKSTSESPHSLFVNETIATKTKPIIASVKRKFYLYNKMSKFSELNSFAVKCYDRCHFSSYFWAEHLQIRKERAKCDERNVI